MPSDMRGRLSVYFYDYILLGNGSSAMVPGRLHIKSDLVEKLVRQQFPLWSQLTVKPVPKSGWDNYSFRLGDELVVRLPSAKCYAAQVKKEQQWLPVLAQHLSYSIPHPVAKGEPTEDYPFSWSIYQWIKGENADTLSRDKFNQFATDAADFLNELHQIDSENGPQPGEHNFFRGAAPSVYESETKQVISTLQDLIDTEAALLVWEEALSSEWTKKPVWIHGDFSAGNILVRDSRLAAIIDFGCMGIGDPACDLVLAWTFLTDESREIFKSQLNIDANTWSRARGWALWKALISLVDIQDKSSTSTQVQLKIINDVVREQAAK